MTTVLGSLCSGGQSINGPMGVAAGPNNTVYVSDTNNQRVVLIDPSRPAMGRLSVIADEGEVSNPWGIVTAANGDVFVVDSGNNVIRRLHRRW
ncbi:MAG: hypothetical protein ACT4TC_01980 [Myxococcaceae bacterium]